MPTASTNRGEEQELAVVHTGQAGRDRDQVTDNGYKATCQRGSDPVIVKVFLTPFYFLLIEQTHLSPFAVGKLINDGAAYVECHKIVDAGTDVGTECSI